MVEAKQTKKTAKPAESKKSVKGLAYYLRQAWKKPDTAMLREKMIAWRSGERITKIDKPTRIEKARALGYKAKKGIVVARVVIGRGGRRKIRHNKKRRTKRQNTRLSLKMNYKWVAEQRAGRKFKNLEVLNSYQLAKDGKYYFFEVILVDPNMPEIKSDRTLKWTADSKNRKRAQRGLTSAAKKSRGLFVRGPESKNRPSQRANKRKGK